MNAFSRPSQCGFPSDTNMLVEACLARARLAAHLDDDVVLPPLPSAAPRREVVVLMKSDVAASTARSLGQPVTAGSADLAPAKMTRARRARRWPLVLCGFVAGAAACAAFLSSPAGQRPAVQRATHAAQIRAVSVLHRGVSLLPSLG